MRPGHPGYISHREIRRWRAAAKEGLLGVCWEGHVDDDVRLESAIGLKTPFPEFPEDMGSSSDESSGVTVSEESDIADPELLSGVVPVRRSLRKRHSPRVGASGSAAKVARNPCRGLCGNPGCPSLPLASGAIQSPPPLVPILPATPDVNPTANDGGNANDKSLESGNESDPHA